MQRERRRRPRGGRPGAAADRTRIDLACAPGMTMAACEHALGWTQEHDLPAMASHRVLSVLQVVLRHGIHYSPDRVTVNLRIDEDRQVRLDVVWSGITQPAPTSGGVELDATVSTLDSFAVDWGFGSVGGRPLHWVLVDASGSGLVEEAPAAADEEQS